MFKKICLMFIAIFCFGCSSWNASLSIFTYNKYIIGDEINQLQFDEIFTVTNKIFKVQVCETNETTEIRSYGNNNRTLIIQGNLPYKSPTTNTTSSNTIPINIPLQF